MYKKLILPRDLITEIQITAIEEMSTFDVNSGQLHFLIKPQHVMGKYLKMTYPELPFLYNCLLFHRPPNFQQALHIDCNNEDPPQLINCAINIPLQNCDDSYMEWYSGAYTTEVNATVGQDGRTRKFVELAWQGEPQLIEKTIIDQPTLVRVNQPHRISCISRVRSLITFRFSKNPDFDTVAVTMT
jgi:hypothetical protein